MVALHCGKIFFSKIKKEIVETPGPGMPALELWVQPPGKGASLCSFQSLSTRPECKCHSLGQLQRGQHGGVCHVPHDVHGGGGLRCHPEPLLAAQRTRETRSC